MKQEIRIWPTVFLVLTLSQICQSDPSFLDSYSSFLNPSISSSKHFPKSISLNDFHPFVKPHKVNDAIESLRQLSLLPTQSFIQRRLFNTSCAFTIPVLSFTLPQRGSEGSSVDLANQLIFGLFGLLVVVLELTVPVLFTGIRPGTVTARSDEGTQGILNRLLSPGPTFNLMNADLSHKIGLDPTKCLQKTICESNRYPKNDNYGVLAIPFQMFYPPPENGTSDSRASIFQMAARDGKYTTKRCDKEYKCFFDVMDLAKYFVDWYHHYIQQKNLND